MRRRALRFLVLGGFALLAAGWTEPPADDAARAARFDPVARFVWPALPCAPLVRTGPEAAAAVGAETAVSDPDTCEVWVRPGLSAYAFCVALAHEYGHLAGYAGDAPGDPVHSASPADLMHAVPPGAWAPCVAHAVTPLKTAVTTRARRLLRGKGWTVRLVRTRHGRRLVVAVRGRSRVVWQVWGSRAAWEMARER